MTTVEQLNRDFDVFYEFCKENDLTDDDVRQLCQPLIKTIRKTRLVKQLKIGVFAMFFLLTLYIVCTTETISWHLSAIGRILMIKLLPFYDWTSLRNEICLIKRPQSNIIEQNGPNCVLCESVDEIAKFDEIIDADAINERYIKLHAPFKTTTKTDLPWKIKSLPVSNLTEMVTKNPALSNSYPCKLSTNLFKNYDDVTFADLLNRAANADRYFIHFQNCEWDAVKQFRVFTPRPAFLPREIAPIQYSWLLLNRDYKIARFKRVDLKENMAVVVQILGATNFRLVPQKRCEFECFEVDVVLEEGEAMVLTSLWDLEYQPVAQKGENVAVVLETH